MSYGGGPNWPMIRAKQRAESEADSARRQSAELQASASEWQAKFEALAERVREAADRAGGEHQQEANCLCRSCWDAVITKITEEPQAGETATGYPGSAGRARGAGPVCACAAVSGARSIEELAEWGERAPDALLMVIGIRRHPLRWRRTPSRTTLGRVLQAVDGNALDRAMGACLADRHHAATRPQAPAAGQRRVIAVDGKAVKGSARLTTPRRHLLSAVTHTPVVTLAQAEVGAKTNETTYLRLLLEPLNLAGTLVTFDALHSV